jgi:hypothetical protein
MKTSGETKTGFKKNGWNLQAQKSYDPVSTRQKRGGKTGGA